MTILIRYIASGPGAVAVTVGLGLLMANLIKVSFIPQEKPEDLSYEINAVPIDDPVTERLDPPILKEVLPPPPAPRDEFEPTSLPVTEWVAIVGDVPDPKPIKINNGPVSLSISDREEQPIVRIPPTMPPRAQKSGHCNMQFDVSPAGQPFNIMATYCTASLFKRASVKSVGGWKYNAKIQNGTAIVRRGLETQITFTLTDERGRKIPE